MDQSKHYFTLTLSNWFSKAKRKLPWRETKDPYKIWLSEIILQQTRVDQGLPYYERFVSQHPTVQSLAECPENDVMKLWEGLGYYSRARNLHTTAKIVTNEHGGQFPGNYDGLLKLKGIGPYTAAAISSIAFGENRPVVDGNVFRFISRYYGIDDDISKSGTRKVFENFLLPLMDENDPGDFNQALMEFGATVCTPAPKCDECTFGKGCFALDHRQIDRLPVKTKKVKVEELKIDYAIIRLDDQFLLQRRNEGIWHGLYQFFIMNSGEEQSFIEKYGGKLQQKTKPIKHLLTHKKLWIRFFEFEIFDEELFDKAAKELHLERYSAEEMLNLPRPKVIVNYLQQAVN